MSLAAKTLRLRPGKMNEQLSKQIGIIEELLSLTESEGIPIWFYGGFGLDALEVAGP